jgi:DNA polymerase III delta prime subunit
MYVMNLEFVTRDHETHVTEMDDWIDKRPSLSLLISGPPGSGKTHFVNAYLKQHNYHVIMNNSCNVQNQLATNDVLYNVFQTNTMQTFPKIAVVFDELESASINDKGCISEIIDFISTLNKYKTNVQKNKQTTERFNLDILLICICQDSYIKKIKQLEKLCTSITFKQPDDDMIRSLLTTHLPGEPRTDAELTHMVKYVRNDIRKLKLAITSVNSEDTKLEWHDIYDITSIILYDRRITLQTILRHYKNQKILIPVMIHENYRNAVLYSKSPGISNHMELISDMVSRSDTIGAYIYNKNKRTLGTLFATMSCYKIANYIHSIPRPVSKTKEKKAKIKFSILVNKLALKCTYKHSYNRHVGTFYDYHMDRDVVKFNTLKMIALIKRDPVKYKYLLETYNVRNNKGVIDEKTLHKINNCI